jgi:hypothetical protein
VQDSGPPRPRGRLKKSALLVPSGHTTAIEEIDADPLASCPHIDRDGLLPTEHLHEEEDVGELQIGPADDAYFDSQEEDFYYDDYNDEDEEEREIWEDGEEVHLEIPPEPLYALDRRGKKRMRMQRRPSKTIDVEFSAYVVSLFASPPLCPVEPFGGYLQHTMGTTMAQTQSVTCTDPTNAGARDGNAGDFNYNNWDCGGGDCNAQAGEREVEGRSSNGREGGQVGMATSDVSRA